MKRERLIPLPEYAKREGISESLARKWLKEGRLEAVRLGHYWYVPEWVEGPRQIYDEEERELIQEAPQDEKLKHLYRAAVAEVQQADEDHEIPRKRHRKKKRF